MRPTQAASTRAGLANELELALRQANLDGHRTELARLLTERRVPDKDDILKVKHLVRDLMPEGEDGDERARSFFSAYFDIYLGRIAGELSLEREGLRRCLEQLDIARDATR